MSTTSDISPFCREKNKTFVLQTNIVTNLCFDFLWESRTWEGVRGDNTALAFFKIPASHCFSWTRGTISTLTYIMCMAARCVSTSQFWEKTYKWLWDHFFFTEWPWSSLCFWLFSSPPIAAARCREQFVRVPNVILQLVIGRSLLQDILPKWFSTRTSYTYTTNNDTRWDFYEILFVH